MGRRVMAPSSGGVSTPVEALSEPRPRPTSPSDVDLAELTDQILQFGQKLWVVHVQLLVLLLMFSLLSLQCIVPQARVVI